MVDTRATRPFAGYERRLDQREDAELTHAGPGTPCGEYLRRFWQPVALSSELTDLPLGVRLLGEDLVLFRTRDGKLGLLDRHCSHRGTSLEYGLVSDQGIRCCYHGWHYGCDGAILETPNDPDGPIPGRVFHGAYPTHEFRGIIFAYMGPPDEAPAFPHLDTYGEPDNDMVPFSLHYPCNWLQVLENTQDPVHSVFLHTRMSGAQFAESWGELPTVDYVETRLGMMNVNIRRWKDKVWLRTTETILPNINQAGALWETAEEEKCFARVSLTRWMRPSDDTHTAIIGWRHFNDRVDPTGEGDKNQVGKEKIDFIGQIEDRDYAERQRIPGDYEAIVSQRPIAIHALENLSATDKGVALLRRLVRRGIRAVAAGEAFTSLPRKENGVVPTYTQDTVVAIPPQPGEDETFLRRMGAKTAAILAETDEQAGAERYAAIAERVNQIN